MRVGCEGWVTTREDETKTIVLHLFVVVGRGRHGPRETIDDVGEFGIEVRASTEPVDRLEAARRDEPGARIRRHSFLRPTFDGGGERLV